METFSFLFTWIFDVHNWLALGTLSIMEIVLGIDNIIFIAVLVSRLPESLRQKARILGLAFACVTRILLLSLIFLLVHLKESFFYIGDFGISWRDVVLFLGGLFLIYKSTLEIHQMAQGESEQKAKLTHSFFLVIAQIALLDIVFSLDSVITAVGMAENLVVMILAIVIAIGVMMLAAQSVSEFVERNPTIKVLALAFLILIGVALVADSLHFHIPKGYLYFAIVFSLGVEMINLWLQRRKQRKE
ncbi:TerC family protein [Helicobacter himalayensis]|uniref:TerC family protein n=1 Tax=Helicobacter himalayensis TaxID=1591088 RepID=UPI00082D592E|nr:TerC family protein [Helicobacter himalayensis]